MLWSVPVDLFVPCVPDSKKNYPLFAVDAILCTHFIQQWIILPDPAIKVFLHDLPLFLKLVDLRWDIRLLDENTILRFHHLLASQNFAEQNLAVVNDLLIGKGPLLRAGKGVDATLIVTSSPMKNKDGRRDFEMHHSKKGNQRYFEKSCHIDVDVDSGFAHTVARWWSINMSDVAKPNSLPRRQKCPATSVRPSGLKLKGT